MSRSRECRCSCYHSLLRCARDQRYRSGIGPDQITPSFDITTRPAETLPRAWQEINTRSRPFNQRGGLPLWILLGASVSSVFGACFRSGPSIHVIFARRVDSVGDKGFGVGVFEGFCDFRAVANIFSAKFLMAISQRHARLEDGDQYSRGNCHVCQH
jgi:hypothetical protein